MTNPVYQWTLSLEIGSALESAPHKRKAFKFGREWDAVAVAKVWAGPLLHLLMIKSPPISASLKRQAQTAKNFAD